MERYIEVLTVISTSPSFMSAIFKDRTLNVTSEISHITHLFTALFDLPAIDVNHVVEFCRYSNMLFGNNLSAVIFQKVDISKMADYLKLFTCIEFYTFLIL